ncbi:hypothetical protein DFQ04_2553 [Algoriphagus boseongensis]|uniref:Uncharacterized protein n=1 Tax=Algoriphagus boseongensis TaxID=1442587 RepID=A0A4R6T4Q5_9BACT|nr:DUF6600 domain-containing protein [Algoriphagus boseongensis]TDQ16435.1 hypothetical protein DFQ04_2553 [Algoriphagus boseongensis]
MKANQKPHWLRIAFLASLMISGLFFTSVAEAKKYGGVSFQVFYDELTPYGDWVKDARHGYIWLPAVYDDFHPYGTNGRWVMTEYGNTWVSDYDWGWATFHYGRWYFDDYYQSWAWIPGYEWAPAWVSWRTGGGYYGWAPLGPGVSISVRVNVPSFHWVFLPQARIYHNYPYHYYAPYAHRVKIINKTKVINNTVVYNNYNFYGGPSRREVEQVTRKVVPVYNIRTSEAPGRMAVSRNEVRVYRPELEQSRGRTVDARPSRVLDANQAKTARSSRQVSPSNSGSSSQSSRSANSQTGSVNRSETPSGRSATPSRNEGFDMKPAPSNSGRTAPSRTAPAQGSRQEQMRTPQPARDSQVRTQPSRDSQVRTQPQNQDRGSVQQRSSAPSRESQVRQPQQRSSSEPQVRTAPSRSSDARVSQPSRTQSSKPEVKSSAPSRSSTSTQSRTSSSSSSRGNSREKNN